MSDVLIIGAGAAGLAAARLLARAGLQVVLLEARDRLGGRIHTLHDPQLAAPVELGPEFLHGRAPETWNIAQAAGLPLVETSGEHWWQRENGELTDDDDTWHQVETLFQEMDQAEGDPTFAEFLAQHCPPEISAEARQRATGFVEGFNAADAKRVSVRWLVEGERASASVQGERQFRIVDGYRALVHALASQLDPEHVEIRRSTVVRRLHWQPGYVRAECVSPAGMPLPPMEARCAIITLPLSLMQAGAVEFLPALPDKEAAAQRLAMGQVERIVLRFREPFWEHGIPAAGDADLRALSFLHGEAALPTWWTAYPLQAPTLVGWAAGPRAEPLVRQDDETALQTALASLAKVTGMVEADLASLLDGWYRHNWHADPYSRGAYSYVPAGALDAVSALAAPVEETLFFAGEATHTEGHASTVHGALATGERAAKELLSAV